MTPGVVFLGCGKAAATHARVLRRLRRGIPLHFASRDHARAEAAARRWGGRAFASYEEALASASVEAAVVTTPPAFHRDLTVRALAAGKHVVVEKPAFPEASDFDAVREAAAAASRCVAVAENYFYRPIRKRLRAVVAEGWIGEPLLLRVNAVKRQRARGWRADPALAGGGALLDGGIHWVNFISNLGLEPVRVRGSRVRPDAMEGVTPAEETWSVAFEFASGAVGILDFSWQVPSALRGVRLSTFYGTEGSVWFESNGIFFLARGRRTRLGFPGIRDPGGFRAMWSDFLGAFRDGRDPEMTLDMAERDVQIVQALYRSTNESQ